jgi:cytochrome c
MKSTFVILAAGVLAAGLAQAQAPKAGAPDPAQALLQKYNCTVACHANDKKVVGPPYYDVALKYRGDASAPAKLAAKVKAGGAGTWGPVPMTPNPTVTDADMKVMIAYVLALKPPADYKPQPPVPGAAPAAPAKK